MNVKIPSELELALLEALERGGRSWRAIASRLSGMEVPRAPDMMVALKALQAKGYLGCRTEPGSPKDTWSLTEDGRERLALLRLLRDLPATVEPLIDLPLAETRSRTPRTWAESREARR